jgi:hypothetical protein
VPVDHITIRDTFRQTQLERAAVRLARFGLFGLDCVYREASDGTVLIVHLSTNCSSSPRSPETREHLAHLLVRAARAGFGLPKSVEFGAVLARRAPAIAPELSRDAPFNFKAGV